MPSMTEAAQIRDVAARHRYVFDNGLCSPDFFDLEKRMASKEFCLLLKHCEEHHAILEIGCFTGLNLLALAENEYRHLTGYEFVRGAIQWLEREALRRGRNICTSWTIFPKGIETMRFYDRVICFDVLEHQLDVGEFLAGVSRKLNPTGQALFLVPEGKEFYDCGHVAFFPDAECLRNVLEYFFEVKEISRLESCPKLFAVCESRR